MLTAGSHPAGPEHLEPRFRAAPEAGLSYVRYLRFPLDTGQGMVYLEGMEITYQDQRKNKTTEINVDLDGLYILAEKAGIPDGTEVRIRVRDENGPYGYTKPVGPNAYRVVVNVRYSKANLSEGAQYVVNNTMLHELRHVAQGCEGGWHSLSSDYHGWSETEARKVGRTIKGQSEFFALS